MKNSSLYRIHPEDKILQSVKEIDFSDFDFKERYDIQEWIESTPEILGEELLIIAKEKTYFDKTRERPDLIAIDKGGNIVVIELKRDDSGENLEWQAIKYASYWSKFRRTEIFEVYKDYLEKNSNENEIDEESVAANILDFIDEDDFENLNKHQRIILVSHRYAKEVTSAVNWLIDKYEIDIKCVQLIPYYDIDRKTYYIQSNTILPIPSVEDLLISASTRRARSKLSETYERSRSDDISDFFNSLKNKIHEKIDKTLLPDKNSRWAGVGNNFRYYHFWYDDPFWDNWNFSYKIWLFDDKYQKPERKNKFGIYLDISRKYLLNKGASELLIKNIENFMKSVKIENIRFDRLNNSIFLETYIDDEFLDKKKLNQLANGIIILIQKTKPEIDKILKE